MAGRHVAEHKSAPFVALVAAAGMAACSQPARAEPAPLLPQLVAFTPGASLRNALSLSPEASLNGDVSVHLVCKIRDDGRLWGCRGNAGKSAPEAASDLAIARSRYYLASIPAVKRKFPDSFDRHGNLSKPIDVEFDEIFRAADRRALGPGLSGERPDHARYVERPAGSLLSALYPAGALRLGIRARLRADCEVVAAGRLFCVDPQVVETNSAEMPESMKREFALAFLAVSGGFRVAERADNGVEMAGLRTRLSMLFEPDE